MEKLRWHHKLDSDAWHEPNMRNVYFGEFPIGRVTRAEHGPREGKWKWSGRWGCLVNGGAVENGGECDSMEEALEALRNCAVRTARDHPNIMRRVFGYYPDNRGAEDIMEALVASVEDEA